MLILFCDKKIMRCFLFTWITWNNSTHDPSNVCQITLNFGTISIPNIIRTINPKLYDKLRMITYNNYAVHVRRF